MLAFSHQVARRVSGVFPSLHEKDRYYHQHGGNNGPRPLLPPTRTPNEAVSEHDLERGHMHFTYNRPLPAVLFFFTLVTGPRRSLRLKLSDARVYEP